MSAGANHYSTSYPVNHHNRDILYLCCMATVELKNKILKYLIEHATESSLSFDKNQLAKRHSMGQGQLSRILTELVKSNLINTSTISDTGGIRCTITPTGYEFFEAGGYKAAEEEVG